MDHLFDFMVLMMIFSLSVYVNMEFAYIAATSRTRSVERMMPMQRVECGHTRKFRIFLSFAFIFHAP